MCQILTLTFVLCVCPCVQTKSRGREDDDDDEGEQEEGEDDGDSANGDESWMWNTHTHISPHQTCTQWSCLLNWLESYLHHMVAITPLMHKFTDMRSTCFRIFFQVGKVNILFLFFNLTFYMNMFLLLSHKQQTQPSLTVMFYVFERFVTTD